MALLLTILPNGRTSDPETPVEQQYISVLSYSTVTTPVIPTSTPEPTATFVSVVPQNLPTATVTPEPTPTLWPTWTPVPQQQVHTASGQVQDWLIAAGWPAELLLEAALVVDCESGGRPNAYNSTSGVYGLFQLWAGWFTHSGLPLEQWHDPIINAKAALGAYNYDISRGYAPWNQWQCKPY